MEKSTLVYFINGMYPYDIEAFKFLRILQFPHKLPSNGQKEATSLHISLA